MSDDEVRVEAQILRSCADVWFPNLAEKTESAGSRVSEGQSQVGAAFAHPADWTNGVAWTSLVDTFAEALKVSSVRLKAAQEALRKAANSYEDTDENSALRIEVTS